MQRHDRRERSRSVGPVQRGMQRQVAVRNIDMIRRDRERARGSE
jgi:hypothetical protein